MLISGACLALFILAISHRGIQLFTSMFRHPAPPQRSVASLPGLPSPTLPGSPFCDQLYHYVCQSKEFRLDPTGTVVSDVEGYRQVLEIQQTIESEHPDWSPEQIDQELTKRIYTPGRILHVTGTFRWVQQSALRFIDAQSAETLTPQEKKILRTRIKKVELDLPGPGKTYEDEPDLVTKTDVFYERTAEGMMRLRVGGAYLLSAKSWFNRVATMAHEIGHAIDPCEMRSIRQSLPSYDRLSGCFLYQGIIATRTNREECGANDQLSEAFADWFSVQIVGMALQKYRTEFDQAQLLHAAANSVRDLCDGQDGPEMRETPDFDFHPSGKIRIEKIFGRDPEMRVFFGCPAVPPEEESCTFHWQMPQPTFRKNPS